MIYVCVPWEDKAMSVVCVAFKMMLLKSFSNEFLGKKSCISPSLLYVCVHEQYISSQSSPSSGTTTRVFQWR